MAQKKPEKREPDPIIALEPMYAPPGVVMPTTTPLVDFSAEVIKVYFGGTNVVIVHNLIPDGPDHFTVIGRLLHGGIYSGSVLREEYDRCRLYVRIRGGQVIDNRTGKPLEV